MIVFNGRQRSHGFHGIEGQLSMTRGTGVLQGIQLSTAEWLRKLYPGRRRDEIKKHGYDCVVGPGELLFVPDRWLHMVLNLGDTLAVVSERSEPSEPN